MEDFILAMTPSGIWKVNEESQEVQQISNDALDAPKPYRRGLSPDKKYYAYITGDITPTLVLINLQTNSQVFSTPLSGPNSQIKPDMDASDPGQSVLLAMQNFDSMAWSPDSTQLAFVGAIENSNTDLYLLNTADLSISRLSDETSNAAYINWSPDGRFIEFVTVNNFGTGAGMNMDAIWVHDRNHGETKLLEQSTSAGEEFVAWIDNESFYIYSWSAMCSSHNLRTINAITGDQEVIFESCFSGVAYDPNGKMGIVAVSDMFIDACQCGDVNDFGTYSFGVSLGIGDATIIIKKFEYINAYNVELLDPGTLFAVYTDEGLAHLFDVTGFPIEIPDAVTGLKPFPSPTDTYWAWFPYYGDKTGLWITDNQNNLIELSSTSTGNVVWRDDGNRLYFIESNRILYADAPDFYPSAFAEIPVSQINAIGK
jgi:WD40 repeat protein